MAPFAKSLFWDCDPASLDFEKHAGFIIGRVVSRGGRSDWEALKQHYGFDRLRAEVVELRDLDPKSLAFCSVYFKIPREEFRCTKTKSSNRAPWIY